MKQNDNGKNTNIITYEQTKLKQSCREKIKNMMALPLEICNKIVDWWCKNQIKLSKTVKLLAFVYVLNKS